ncbi:NUDIX domain-containing protein [Nonlabens ponticola]|uniref:ADP-ribose pyrophosphatase n=1 Tax=Nonlabens ponticola TaxID=2496866 RepID=A0A3S9MYF3_9FLAO|nr:NUDIX domain-containing protein [Nonlabens ponticola]AZQ44179.1 NUDIX domain-containing protein [Nonlabens ponticola]
MNYTIENEKAVYDGFLRVIKAQVIHDRFHDNQKINATRECLERGDSAAVLIYEKDTDQFIFTRQFRYPSARREHPWMLELVAGSIDKNEKPEACAKRETLEELGYQIKDLERIASYFPSPGGCSEQIQLFYAQVRTHDRTNDASGNPAEKEDIELVKISRQEAYRMLMAQEINNSISLIGLQWFFLNQKTADR